MKKHLAIVASTVLALVLLDLLVGTALRLADGRVPALQGLVRFFDYGRSVPGKLQEWEEHPEEPENLYDVAWRTDMLATSAIRFAEDPADVATVRVYGMSFVNHVFEAAQRIEPTLRLDAHSGPGAPPNFAYAVFLDDRANRRKGDIVALGILSSAIAPLAAMSNRTWAFEQPAPFTYPVFLPEGDTLRRIEPLVNSADEERALATDPIRAAAWDAQLRSSDALWSPAAFSLPILDQSPFARLVRRSLAIGTIDRREQALLANPEGAPLPYATILRRMVTNFARIAREDGQIPVVVLIQTRDLGDPDLRGILWETLEAGGIPYLATADYQQVSDPTAFLPDGHYTPAVNAEFGQALLDILSRARTSE